MIKEQNTEKQKYARWLCSVPGVGDKMIDRLSAGMQAAGQKGINESLVMVDQLAFIVNVKNQTVITALDKNDSNGNVFTNIDGAVIA